MYKGTCTLCFAVDIKTFDLKETNLQSVYEHISRVKIESEVYHICYICRVRLYQCHLLVEQIKNAQISLKENNIQKCQPLLQLTSHRCKDISIVQSADQSRGRVAGIRDSNENVYMEEEQLNLEVKEELDCNNEDLQGLEYEEECLSNDECSIKREDNLGLPTLQIDSNNVLLDIVLPDSITVTRKQSNDRMDVGADMNGLHSMDLSSIDKSDIDIKNIDTGLDDNGLDLSSKDINSLTVTGMNKGRVRKITVKSDKTKKSPKNGVEKKFRCDICDKTFKRSTYVTIHKRIHTGAKPYACDICPERFRHASHLATHKVTHTRDKPYSCRFCAKRFSHSSSLLMHTKTHTHDKRFSCEVCEKKFHRRHDLKTHNRIHNGEKPYTCDVCSKKFTHVSHLITHKRTHTGVKLYHCEVCKKRFKHSSGVKKHMERKHKGSYILGV